MAPMGWHCAGTVGGRLIAGAGGSADMGASGGAPGGRASEGVSVEARREYKNGVEGGYVSRVVGRRWRVRVRTRARARARASRSGGGA